ncbi:hypothetical protein KSF73_16525 [Burkholderiaceae bacterium DAT-1]|nr:hypothetical protein [Burkholderiaceae bacterium DAT-1]
MRLQIISLFALGLTACGGGSSSSSSSGGGDTSGYVISGTIVGLNGNGLTLVNGKETLTIKSSDTSFAFATKIATGATYAVTAGSNPFWQKCTVANGSGTVASANISNVAVTCVSATVTVKTVAGGTTVVATPVTGNTDGTGTKALFKNPKGLIVAPDGNIYIVDTGNNLIRKMTSAGVVTTFAGSGFSGFLDGTTYTANFNAPTGIAVDKNGNLYIADTGNNAIRKITKMGEVTTLAGSSTAGAEDGLGAAATFNGPTGLAVDGDGNVYVADAGNFSIRKITAGGLVSTLAGGSQGYVNATGSSAQFCSPNSAVLNKDGNILVTDQGAGAVRMITPTGVVTTYVGISAASNPGCLGATKGNILFAGIALDSMGTAYATSPLNGTTVMNQILLITPGGSMITLAGGLGAGVTDGTSAKALFDGPQSISVDTNGNLYVADSLSSNIRYISHN